MSAGSIAKRLSIDPLRLHEHFDDMRGSKKLCQRGPTLTVFFVLFCFVLVDEGERIQIPLKEGPHWPTSETPLNGVSLLCL